MDGHYDAHDRCARSLYKALGLANKNSIKGKRNVNESCKKVPTMF